MIDDEITLSQLNDRLKKVETQLPTLQASISANTQVTQEATAKTDELLSVVDALKGTFATIERIGKLLKPIGYIAAAVGAILGMITAWKTGKFFG